jgi:hypothetical protein
MQMTKQGDQHNGHHLGATNDRRLVGFAVRQWRADRCFGKRRLTGEDTQLGSPSAQR